MSKRQRYEQIKKYVEKYLSIYGSTEKTTIEAEKLIEGIISSLQEDNMEEDKREIHLKSTAAIDLTLEEIQEEVEIVRKARYERLYTESYINKILQERELILKYLKNLKIKEQEILGYLENFDDIPDGFTGREILVKRTKYIEEAKKKNMPTASINLMYHFIETYPDKLSNELQSIRRMSFSDKIERKRIIELFSNVAAASVHGDFKGFGHHIITTIHYIELMEEKEFITEEVKDSYECFSHKPVNYEIVKTYVGKMYDGTHIAYNYIEGNKTAFNRKWFIDLIESAYYVAPIDVVDIVTYYYPITGSNKLKNDYI